MTADTCNTQNISTNRDGRGEQKTLEGHKEREKEES